MGAAEQPAGAGLAGALAGAAAAAGAGAALPFSAAGRAAAAVPLAGLRGAAGDPPCFVPSLLAAAPGALALPRAPCVAAPLRLLRGGMSALSWASVRKPPLGTYLHEQPYSAVRKVSWIMTRIQRSAQSS